MKIQDALILTFAAIIMLGALALGSCGCTTVKPTTILQPETTAEGSGGAGGGDTGEAGAAGQGGTAPASTTATGSGGGGAGGSTDVNGACLGYDGGILSACRQPLTEGECANYGWTYDAGGTCPTGNLVGCCYYALEYLCYYSPTFSPDIANQCAGEWQAP